MQIIAGIVFDSDVLNSEAFHVLAAFVAVNTLVYMALAIGKILPRIYWSKITGKFRPNRRRAPRGINPAASPVDDS